MNGISDLPVGDVIFDGVPFPQHGAMFGWRPDGGDVAALIQCSVKPEPQDPGFTTMPRTDVPEAAWMPVARPRFGSWFWDYYRDGRIVDLAPLLGDTQDLVFWVDTISATGSGSIAVEMDLDSPDGWTLPRGVYVYYPVARDHRALSLDDLLADPGKVDLGPRFRAVGT
jgi:hypothetical protein